MPNDLADLISVSQVDSNSRRCGKKVVAKVTGITFERVSQTTEREGVVKSCRSM
jgi:hypothetical protein